MKKLLCILILSIISLSALFASDVDFGLGIGLGVTPCIDATLKTDRFAFDVEGNLIGGHVSLGYDVLPSAEHDLEIGIGAGRNYNPLLNVLVLLFSLGQAEEITFLTADLTMKYSYNINEHNALYIQMGIPVFAANMEGTNVKNIRFEFRSLEALEEAWSLALFLNTKVGYRYTF